MVNKNKFSHLLKTISGLDSHFTLASGPFPARKACAVCPTPTDGMIAARPVNFFVQSPASGCPSPQRRWNASRQIPAVGTGQADWVTCTMTAASGNQISVPNLWHIRTNGPAPDQSNAPSQYWVEVTYIGYGY